MSSKAIVIHPSDAGKQLGKVLGASRGKASKPGRLGSTKAMLNDVACASPTVCYAVSTRQGLSGYVIKA